MSVRTVRVQFIHGLESSPSGDKARYLAARFDALTPAMDTGDFGASVEVQRAALERFRPDVLVGSSFGGAVALALLQSGAHAGPTLLLAPAIRAYGLPVRLPAGVRVRIIHGTRDAIVPIEDSRALAQTGTSGLVDLVEIEDEHRLGQVLVHERLQEFVRELSSWQRGRPGLTQ